MKIKAEQIDIVFQSEGTSPTFAHIRYDFLDIDHFLGKEGQWKLKTKDTEMEFCGYMTSMYKWRGELVELSFQLGENVVHYDTTTFQPKTMWQMVKNVWSKYV